MRAWVAAQMCRVCLLRHSWRLLGLSKLVGRPGLLQGAWLGLLGGALRGSGSITVVHLQVQELLWQMQIYRGSPWHPARF